MGRLLPYLGASRPPRSTADGGESLCLQWRVTKNRREQNVAFNEAAATVVAAVPGVTRGQRRALAIDLMKEAMGPLARFVRIKTKMLSQRSSLM